MARDNSFTRVAVIVLATITRRTSAAIGPIATLPIVNKLIAPDGVPRNAVLADATFPGPVISGYTGDFFKIDVKDELYNSTMLTATSIHWHGILQHRTNWADGVAFVTQCPITSGQSFEYKFDTTGISGTHWYHSHLESQYCDGLRGPLVLYDKDDPHKDLYDVDDESTIITLADWYHVASPFVLTRSRVPKADSTLINGMGRWYGNPTAELAVVKVTQGKRYRFRLLNMGCDPDYTFTIAGHSMTVIEADGQNSEPLTVDEIQIFVGQRYSFVLEADQPVDNYWIRALPNVMMSRRALGSAKGINSAILRYDGAPEEEPTQGEVNSTNPLREYNLHALTDPAAPGEPYVGGVDYALNLQLGFPQHPRKATAPANFTVNGVPFESPSVPVLLNILSGAARAQDLLPKGNVYTLPRNASVELTIPHTTIGSHAFHLHGHIFSVVRSAGQAVPNYRNPIRRDVVSTGSKGDNVTVRFRTDNPGPWFLHCHVDWHLATGMAVVFAEDVPDVPSNEPAPEEWYNLCPEYEESLARDRERSEAQSAV
ncbi:transporter [Ganoderma sinense ZZ0214-1]|uniref:laccase n=1 Tax=Ganoderma sinense ZZ0214-1 TaxID=1077348 RepID=A0A2G8S9I7_9APHY|nr:transporter [Ganoderma sinense ZZ0214-1]